MKRWLFTCILLIAFTDSFSQSHKNNNVPALPLVANKVVYTATIPLDSSISKATLFNNAQQWYKKHIESADNVLTVDKADSGKLSGTGIIHTRNHEKRAQPYDIYFTIDINVARGAYQYRVYDIYSFDKNGRFYYSDMYNEELYPLSKPKWSEDYREIMLNHMNDLVNIVLNGLDKAIKGNDQTH